ncbi:DUF3995 domain-containing protein [Gracilibacillus alcaliphilus]|uniref:DUF3995 domain-containing protein n=1 Tax=Gracilibacillus alcaliphilus TaxID=1401441 RepID=UPI00195CDBA5|nr:DUF3995 domain-containing protein [Gracilibacillus alcaliphilus]MBM7675720.1 glucan phosphoethanolaminetransferase (alkaline phosphatase superfamily) [Gracilibacillus alcaliphilus]
MEQSFSFRRNHWFVVLGIAWTIIFAGMSFYWAIGGMLGVRSLGGAVYEMSLNPEPSFIMIVWLTGLIKLLGAILLLLLFVQWSNAVIKKILYYIAKAAGVLLFLYGLLNFITISMSAINLLQFDLDAYATFWRLVFWEPFWMLGGVCYFFAVKR